MPLLFDESTAAALFDVIKTEEVSPEDLEVYDVIKTDDWTVVQIDCIAARPLNGSDPTIGVWVGATRVIVVMDADGANVALPNSCTIRRVVRSALDAVG